VKTAYDDTMTMREARKKYFDVNGFGDNGGYDDAWVDFKLGPVPMPFPNTKGRVRAVKFHDLHHILTDFDTDVAGEFEISAWEIAAGCKDFGAAWVINLGGLAAGALVRCPVRTFRAFVRGRREETTYGHDIEEMLDLTVEDARERFAPLTGKAPPKATLGDAALFATAVVTGFAVGMTSLVFGLPLVPVGLAMNFLRRRSESATA
jgi:hypothetical protein